MPIKPWFPTFIYDSPLQPRGNDAFARALLDDCHKIRAHDRAGQRWCRKNYPAGYTSYGTMTNLHQTFSTFIDLEAKIRRHVNRFARRLDMNLQGARLAMTDCWVNVMSRHAVHSLHLHPLAVVSGTYYVATPPGSLAPALRGPAPRQADGRATEARPLSPRKPPAGLLRRRCREAHPVRELAAARGRLQPHPR